MLILRRKEGQWVEVTHRSGETIRIRVCNIRSRHPGQLDLAFDDPAHNFSVQRPERGANTPPAPVAEPGAGAELLPISVDTGAVAVAAATAPTL